MSILESAVQSVLLIYFNRPETKYSESWETHHLVNKEQRKNLKPDFPDSFLF